jgi:Sec-independent protein secretion pathway component TatC
MNKGVPLLIGLCCVWPLIVHFGWVFIQRGITQRDWSNIQWSDIPWPWRKNK